MHQGLQFLDIIFLALIAGFVFFRLRNVLGRRTGNERPPHNPYSRRAPAPNGTEEGFRPLPAPEDRRPRALGGATLSPEMSPSAPGVTQLKLADPHFDETRFLEGAQSAHEMVVQAFASGDRATLRDLVAPDVFDSFDSVIRAREAKGEKAEAAVIEMDRAEIVSAEIRGAEASVTVRLVSEIVSCVKNNEGQLVEGHPSVPHKVTDVWTFGRDTKSRDPNWTLIATAGEA